MDLYCHKGMITARTHGAMLAAALLNRPEFELEPSTSQPEVQTTHHFWEPSIPKAERHRHDPAVALFRRVAPRLEQA